MVETSGDTKEGLGAQLLRLTEDLKCLRRMISQDLEQCEYVIQKTHELREKIDQYLSRYLDNHPNNSPAALAPRQLRRKTTSRIWR